MNILLWAVGVVAYLVIGVAFSVILKAFIIGDGGKRNDDWKIRTTTLWPIYSVICIFICVKVLFGELIDTLAEFITKKED